MLINNFIPYIYYHKLELNIDLHNIFSFLLVTLNNIPCMKSYISCNRIIGLKVINVICLGSHLNDRIGMLIAKIHGCLFEYGRLNGNESLLIKYLWYITNKIIHKSLQQKEPM